MREVIKFFWPSYITCTERKEEAKNNKNRKDNAIEKIGLIDWSKSTDVALEQAQRILDGQMERSRTAGGKAATLISAMGILVSVLIFFISILLNINNLSPWWLLWWSVPVGISVIYISASLYWIKKTQEEPPYNLIYIKDILDLWESNKINKKNTTNEKKKSLIKDTLEFIQENEGAANDKVTGYSMALDFLILAIGFPFVLSLIGTITYFTYIGIRYYCEYSFFN